jgi:hypothetical protein
MSATVSMTALDAESHDPCVDVVYCKEHHPVLVDPLKPFVF